MSTSIYQQLEDACLPLLTSYKTDLTTHDKVTLYQNPTTPFLHFTRPLGTDLVMLYPSKDKRWPAKGIYMPYLLGVAERHHILFDSTIAVVSFEKDRTATVVCHYFDGTKLIQITLDEALKIAISYVSRVEDEWKEKES